MDRVSAKNSAERRPSETRAVDPVWTTIKEAAQASAAGEPVLAG